MRSSFMKLNKISLSLLFTALPLAACQHQPMADEDMSGFKMEPTPAAEPVKLAPVVQGNIFMRRSDDGDYQLPPRQIDLVRKELETLNTQLAQIHKDTRKDMNGRFETLDAWLADMQKQRAKESEEKAVLLKALDEKFSEIESKSSSSAQRLSSLEGYQKAQADEKLALLKALDEKFAQVEEQRTDVEKRLQQVASEDVNGRRLLEEQKTKLENEIASIKTQTKAQQVQLAQLNDENLTRLMSLERMQKQREKEKGLLLKALDEKFTEMAKRNVVLEDKLAAVASDDLAGRMRLQREKEEVESALKRIKEESSFQKQALAELEGDVKRREEMASIRSKALKEGREMRLMEEFELRKMVSEARRGHAKAEAARQVEEERRRQQEMLEVAEKRQVLQQRVVTLQDKLTILTEQEQQQAREAEARRQHMEERLQARLWAMKEEYDLKVAKLKEQNEKDVIEKFAALEEKHKADMAEAEEYRHAIEERIFAMESQGIAEKPRARNLDDPEGIHVTGNKIGKKKSKSVNGLPVVEDPDIMTEEPGVGVIGSTNPADWVSLGSYSLVVHEDNKPLDHIIRDAVRKAEPFVGPWKIKWKLKKGHMDILDERFSLDAETTFNAFANYISNFMRSHRGFELTFNLFEEDRVLVITDEVL